MSEANTLEIDPTILTEKLRQLEADTEGDLARVIELLLLENHVLQQHRSARFLRGMDYEFLEFPRFLQLQSEEDFMSDD